MEKISALFSKIQRGNNAIFRSLYGNSDSIIKYQVDRYVNLVRLFSDVYGHEQSDIFCSPGRTEIGGNHTDHNFGRVLAGAINLDNIAVATVNNSANVRIHSLGYPDIVVDLTQLEAKKDEYFTSGALVRGIAARLKELGFEIGGFDAVVDGAVPKGSGLSSSASFEVLIGSIFSHLFNSGKVDPIQNALIGQYAENKFFGKPCGLMDQTACATGGFITIDFKDPNVPRVKKVKFDFESTGYSLIITDTGGNHANLNDEYSAIPIEMKSVANSLGFQAMRDITQLQLLENLPKIRNQVGDRALLRAYHFLNENDRVLKEVDALENNDFSAFLKFVIESGYSSYMFNQNIFTVSNVREQGVSLALALSEMVLKDHGAWRVHGGGFAGTIQAFVPNNLVNVYVQTLEDVFGKKSCQILSIRQQGSDKLIF